MPIKELVGKPELLNELTQIRQAASCWRDWLCTRLPDELAGHVIAVTARGPTLYVQADSAAWATRLRYALQPLAGALAERDAALQEFAVRTR